MNDGYSFEEMDDPRTWTGELVPDCEKRIAEEEEGDLILPVLEYLGEFKALIDACGKVSYYYNMKAFVAEGINKAKAVASAYHHDLRYYRDGLDEWRVKAKRSFAVLSSHAEAFGYDMPNERAFLNGLTLSKDRREAYKDYLKTCLKNNTTLSPEEMEEKFQLRLRKRFKGGKK